MHGYSLDAIIGFPAAAFIHPEGQPNFTKYVNTVRSGATAETLVRDVRQDGSTFPASWRGTAFAHRGQPCVVSVVRDVSRRIQAEQRLRERFRARSREQSTLLRISHVLASTLELQPDLVLEQLQEIIDFKHAAFLGLTDSTLVALAIRGPQPAASLAPFRIHLEDPEALEAMFNGHRPIRIADVRRADPAAELLRSFLTGDAAGLMEGVRAWMWVPVAVKGRVLGGIGLGHARRAFFNSRHAVLALSIADQVAITMANVELYEHAQSLAALQERQRLAQDLHDAVNQSLFSAGLIAEVLPRLWDIDQVEARQSLEDLRRLTRGALAEMRGLLAELRPSVLTDSTLGDLLRQLASAFTGRTNVPAIVTITEGRALPTRIQVALYRICQEAFNNIAKHAGAGHVAIDVQVDSIAAQSSSPAEHTPALRSSARSVEMRIRDDGHGFDAAQPAAAGHFGLAMMRERAEEIGARLEVTSRPGHGTDIFVRWVQPREREAP